jgi:hypothetical protein
MLRFACGALLALSVLAAPAAHGQGTNTPLTVKTFTLHHLQPKAAATLVSPYVQSPRGGVYEAGGTIQAITVRETPPVLARIDSVLRDHDRAPATLVFRFQLIAAEDSAVHDPAIAETASALSNLFRFAGYRLLTQGTTLAGANQSFSLTMAADSDRYELSGYVEDVDAGDRAGSVQLHVRLVRLTGGATISQGKLIRDEEELLQTGLTVPLGQSVVLGSAASRGHARALILSLKPEIAAPAKR